MKDSLTPSNLRANLYRLLDRVIATGEPITIERNGRRLKIVAEQPQKLSAIAPHPDFIQGDAEDLIHMDWSDTWRP